MYPLLWFDDPDFRLLGAEARPWTEASGDLLVANYEGESYWTRYTDSWDMFRCLHEEVETDNSLDVGTLITNVAATNNHWKQNQLIRATEEMLRMGLLIRVLDEPGALTHAGVDLADTPGQVNFLDDALHTRFAALWSLRCVDGVSKDAVSSGAWDLQLMEILRLTLTTDDGAKHVKHVKQRTGRAHRVL